MPGELDKLSNHFCNEQLQRVWKPNEGMVEKWVRTGQQHWKDCAAMACAAGDEAGFVSTSHADDSGGSDEPDAPAALDWGSLS